MVYATATYQVAHALFHDAKKSLKQVRLVKSRATNKWYMPIVELAMLINTSIDRLRERSVKYVWDQDNDGPCLYSTMRKKKLIAYFAVDDTCRLFLDGIQTREFAQWLSAPPPPPAAGEGAGGEKRTRSKTAVPEEEKQEAASEKPLRKRATVSPPSLPPPAAGAKQALSNAKRIKFVLGSKPVAKDALTKDNKFIIQAADPILPLARPPPQAAAPIASTYEQIVREWFAENKQQLQEQAIERLMEKEEVRQAAIERVAKELALAARPTAQEMISKLFDANFE